MPKKKVKVKTQNINATPIRDWIYGGLLVVVLAIMPLVVRFRILAAPPELYAMYLEPAFTDLFSYYKGWFIGLPATLILLYFILELFTDGFANFNFKSLLKSPPMIASGVFLLMVLLSTVFSSYRYTSWHGTVDRGEGFWILHAYFIVFLGAMFYMRKDKHAKLLMYGLAFSSIIMGLIGLSQFLGRDFFLSSFGQWFLRLGIPQALRDQATDETINARFIMAYGTLYNPNPFGKYTAMVAPVLLASALVFDEKGWKGICGRLAFLLGGGLMLVGVFASRSLGGFIGIGAASAAILVTFVCRFFYQMFKRKKEAAVEEEEQGRRWVGWVIGVGAAIAITMGLFFVPIINERLEMVVSRFEEALQGERQPLDDMVFDGNSFTYFSGGGERFTLALVGEWDQSEDPEVMQWLPHGDNIFLVHDARGEYVPLLRRTPPTEEDPAYTYVYEIPDFGRISVRRTSEFILFNGIGMTMLDGRIYGLAPNGDFLDLNERAPSFGFEGRERWGSDRGYIWSRTLPLLPSTFFIGTGPDTFTQAFPQNDVVAKMLVFNNPYIPIDKAHNVYLQTWVTTGGISALALVFLFVFYLFNAFLSIVRSNMKEGKFLFGLQAGLFAGISAFAVSAFSTDSTIGSSGVFYLLLGLGYGVLFAVKKIAGAESEARGQKSEGR